MTTTCPYCAEEIKPAARKCKHCNELLDEELAKERKETTAGPAWNPGVAALLSLVIPGAGQMYKGNVSEGLGWLIVVLIGYVAFIVPGLILHAFCIFAAASGKAPGAAQTAKVAGKQP